jgi:hypothetical protein
VPGWKPDLSQVADGRLQAQRNRRRPRPTCGSCSNGSMKAIYDLPAPAKLNLFLHITGRRDDGYHLLQSVFMLIDWHDTLHFEAAPRRRS